MWDLEEEPAAEPIDLTKYTLVTCGFTCTFNNGEINANDLGQLPRMTEAVVVNASYSKHWPGFITALAQFKQLKRLEMRRNCLQVRSPHLFEHLKQLT